MGTDLSADEKAVLFETLLRHSPMDLVWMFSAAWDELIFLRGDYEALWGRSRARLEEEPSDFLRGVHPDDRDDVEAAMERLSGGESVDIEYRVDPDAGYDRWVAVHGEPIRDEDGDTRRVLGFTRDITARKERERELERQNERLDEFVGIVSHDLRNPLSVARGRLELARAECDSDHLEDVERAHRRMDDLIEDLLTLAREGSTVTTFEAVPLAEIADESWDSVATSSAALVTETDAVVRADRARLRQLLENLYRNAIEHGGSDVTVTIGELESGMGFYVADDGAGIPADERERVLENGYSTSEDGTGYGLNIVTRIAEAHGWRLDVGESEDGGARFAVSGVDMDR